MKTTFNNQTKDHRLRALFPTDLDSGEHRVDSMFELQSGTKKPHLSRKTQATQHQQAFVEVSGERAGLTVVNLGLNEYEMLRNRRNTIAITLLRSVGELGDWGWSRRKKITICLKEYLNH
ncbi:Mannosylglycerate hydrolase [compost metagenome]